MAIPLATTTVTVTRLPADTERDPYDPPPARETVATAVRAVISTSSGSETVAGSAQSIVNFRMSCDRFDGGLDHNDQVTDDTSGEVYEVVWAVDRRGLDLDHFQSGLRQVSGIVSAVRGG